MDANKLQVLRGLPYVIPKTCGLCKHGQFLPSVDWGSCSVTMYEHQKHSESHRQLSIYRGGSCAKFEEAEKVEGLLGTFKEFLGP
jgi:hypothetical protein